MNKKYFLAELNSYEKWYHCIKLYKVESEAFLRKHLEKTMASDMYIVEIKEVDYENDRENIMKKVSVECKMYHDYEEI
ncbi:MAG TPA: hypothetical protein GX708_11645 [Gallicola sp.]|nr:hypothetical protein [Gallicola sp.]